MPSISWVLSHFLRFEALRLEVAWRERKAKLHARKLAVHEARMDVLRSRFKNLEHEIESRNGKADI